MKAAKYIWGLWPALELKMVSDRRWLSTFGLYLYSRPCAYLLPRTSGHVYSRPRAWSGKNAALSFGSQESDNDGIISFSTCSGRTTPCSLRSPPPRLGGPETFRPERAFQTRLCKIPINNRRPSGRYLPAPRIPHPEISKLTKKGHAPVRLIPNTEMDTNHLI